MLAQITSFLGGRVAEELIFDDVSSGTYDDFKQTTLIAQVMVTKLGMSDLGVSQDSEFSNKAAIDNEIKKIIDNCYKQATQIMKENKSLLDKIVDILLKQETITKEQIDKLDTGTKMTQEPQETKTTTTTKSKSKQNTKTKRKSNS
ncbi:MAG: cell division protein FtsH, partial [Candidatus Phytoplasma sp. TWB_XP]